MSGILVKHGKLGHTENTQGEGHMMTEAEFGVMYLSINQGMPRISSNHQK